MRVYAGARREDVVRLAHEEQIDLETVQPDSEDEEDEFAAMEEAARRGIVVIAADVDDPVGPIELAHVAAWHVDADGSGDLAWYATQELDHVLDLLAGQ